MPEDTNIDQALEAGGYPPPTGDERAQLAAYWAGLTGLRDRVEHARLGDADPAVSYTPWRPEHD